MNETPEGRRLVELLQLLLAAEHTEEPLYVRAGILTLDTRQGPLKHCDFNMLVDQHDLRDEGG